MRVRNAMEAEKQQHVKKKINDSQSDDSRARNNKMATKMAKCKLFRFFFGFA